LTTAAEPSRVLLISNEEERGRDMTNYGVLWSTTDPGFEKSYVEGPYTEEEAQKRCKLLRLAKTVTSVDMIEYNGCHSETFLVSRKVY
jgi:hypothetical protein